MPPPGNNDRYHGPRSLPMNREERGRKQPSRRCGEGNVVSITTWWSRIFLALALALSLALGTLPAVAAGQGEQPARYIVVLREQQAGAKSESVRAAVDMLAQAVSV